MQLIVYNYLPVHELLQITTAYRPPFDLKGNTGVKKLVFTTSVGGNVLCLLIDFFASLSAQTR